MWRPPIPAAVQDSIRTHSPPFLQARTRAGPAILIRAWVSPDAASASRAVPSTVRTTGSGETLQQALAETDGPIACWESVTSSRESRSVVGRSASSGHRVLGDATHAGNGCAWRLVRTRPGSWLILSPGARALTSASRCHRGRPALGAHPHTLWEISPAIPRRWLESHRVHRRDDLRVSHYRAARDPAGPSGALRVEE